MSALVLVAGGASAWSQDSTADPLEMTAPEHAEWTAGLPYHQDVVIRGGTAPYTLSALGGPLSFVFDGAGQRIGGAAPAAGTYEYTLVCRDRALPPNEVTVRQTLVVNAKLKVELGEFTAFAAMGQCDRAFPVTGGTRPFTVVQTRGTLPEALNVEPGPLAWTGSPPMPGFAAVGFTVTDAAGSTDQVNTTAVVCGASGPVTLAAGDAAAGTYFDAIRGSTVTVSLTAKKGTRRPLQAVLLGHDGSTPVTAKLKAGKGKALVSRFVAPSTGRYYLVVSSDEGAQTTLVAKSTVTPPSKGAGVAAELAPGGSVDVRFGALRGADVTLTAKPKEAGSQIAVQDVLDPTGLSVPFTSTPAAQGGVAVSTTATLSGTFTVVLGCTAGGPVDVKYGFKVRQPKGVAYHDGELVGMVNP